jgi:hypothetical protein
MGAIYKRRTSRGLMWGIDYRLASGKRIREIISANKQQANDQTIPEPDATRTPHDVIQEDRTISRTEEEGLINLAKHRWHWTLDEQNPGRVSVDAYADQTQQRFTDIYACAHGYARYLAAGARCGIHCRSH